MKKSYFNNAGVLLLAMLILLFQQCKPAGSKVKQDSNTRENEAITEGSGFPEFTPDSIFRSLIKPPNREIVSSMPSIRVRKEKRIFSVPLQGIINYDARNYVSVASRFSGRIEKLLVKYNFQPVKKGQLIMEVYSPEIANAQRELIYLHTSGADAGLIEAAKQRLRLLGINEKEISHALNTGEPLYRFPVYAQKSGYLVERSNSTAAPTNPPDGYFGTSQASGGDAMGMGVSAPAVNVNTLQVGISVPISLTLRQGQYVASGQTLFTLYDDQTLLADFFFPPELANYARVGRQLLYYPSARQDEVKLGTIALVEPLYRQGQNFTVARMYLTGSRLQPGVRISGTMAVTTNEQCWVPRSAIVSGGMQQIIFLKKKQQYVPRYVKTGLRIGDFVEVLDDLEGLEIAANAWFLVDSESFISANNPDLKEMSHE